jgi:PAS domain S-box-containing protein
VSALLWLQMELPLNSAEADAPRPPSLTRVEQVRGLAPAEARLGYGVRLVGVVTFSDPGKGLLFVQDASGGIFVVPQAQAWNWPVGRQVEITGVTAEGSHLPFVNLARLQDLGPGTLPQARSVTFTRLATDIEDGNWVEVRGVVRTATIQKGRTILEIAAEGKRLKATFIEEPISRDDPAVLVDAEVRLQGVAGVVDKNANTPAFLEIHVASITNLAVEVKAPAQPIRATAQPIKSLLGPLPTTALIHRLRVTGTLNRLPDGTWQISDATGAIKIQSTPPLLVASNSPVDVVAFPDGPPPERVLEDATVFLPAWPQDAASPAGGAAEPLLPVLTQAEAVRNLPVSEAHRGYPVRVQGVVTYTDTAWKRLFIQDETSGISIELQTNLFAGKAGQAVAVQGYSGMGSYAPIVRHPRFQLLGTERMPMARSATPEQLKSGQEDSQLVEVLGIVRHLTVDRGHLAVTISANEGLLKTYVPNFGTNAIPAHLTDAEVQVRGVCDTVVNQESQGIGFRLLTAELGSIRVTKPAPSDPFALPVQSIDKLFQFRSPSDLRHRIHVRGTVTFRDAQWCTLFLQNEQASLYVRTLTAPTMAIGDQVDVVGFAGLESYGTVLSEALFQRSSPGSPPRPTAVTIAQAISGEFQSRLITLEARLVDRIRGTAERGLVLQEAEWGLTALLESTQSPQRLAALREGSRLRLTGICRLEAGDDQAAMALRLQLRTADDVVVLKQPPRWTARQWMMASGVAGLFFVAAASWVFLLRRNVREQTEVIRRELERQSALERQYGELFNNVNDLIQSLHPDGSFAYVNPAWLNALGYTAAEIRRLAFRDVVHPDDLPRCTRWLEQAMGGQTLDRAAVRFRRKDGQVIEVEGNFSASTKAGLPVAIRSIFRDVTQRNQADAQLRKLNRALRTLSECNQALVRAADEAELLNRVCQLMTSHGGYRMAWVGYAEQDPEQTVRPVAQAGFESAYLEALKITWSDSEREPGPIGIAIRTRQPFIARKVTQDHTLASRSHATPERRCEASASVPLVRDDRVLGALMVYADDPATFDADEVALLTELASDLAYGITALRTAAERRRAGEAVRSANQQLLNIIEFLPDATFVIDQNKRIIAWNLACETLTGVKKEAMLGQGDYAYAEPLFGERRPILVDLLDRPSTEVKAAYKYVRQEGNLLYAESFIPRLRGGQGAHLWGVAAPLFDQEGRRCGAIEVIRDVTEQRRTEQALLESERKYRQLVENANSIILRWSSEGQITFLNEFGQRFFGYSASEILGRHVLDTIVPPTESGGRDLRRLMERICADPEAFEQSINENMRRNGERVWVAWTNRIEHDTAGQVVGILSVGTDITARKRAEEGLRQSEEQFRLIMENLADLVAVLDLDGRRLYNSPSYQSILSDPEKLRGSYSFEEVHPEDKLRVQQAFAETVRTGVGQRLEYRLVDPSGRTRHIESQGSIIRDAQGRVMQVLVVSRDVTERRQAEEAIRELNAGLERRVAERTAELAVARDRAEAADRLKSAFLATMSHELRTPLNSIIGFTGILLQGLAGPLNAEQLKQLEMVRDSARHLLALINDVLDISKIEAGQIEIDSAPFDLRESIYKVVSTLAPFANKKQLLLVVQAPPEVGQVTSDRRRVEQILLNLLNNALKFTEHGQVTLTAEIRSGVARISVTDTGMGIKPEDQARLFQPFRQLDTGLTRQHEGTGLGLAICKRLVERLGGVIWVESQRGMGSTFWFTLPVGEPL